MSRTGRVAEGGFTLLEVLIVVVVLSLAASVVGFALPDVQTRVRLSETGAKVESLLLAARAEARRASAIRWVVFDLDARRYHVDGSDQWNDLPLGLELSVTSARELGSPRQPVIAFLPDGTSSGGVITLRGSGGVVTRRVEWLTGAVRDDID
jgi:general secretion pathway protein H